MTKYINAKQHRIIFDEHKLDENLINIIPDNMLFKTMCDIIKKMPDFEKAVEFDKVLTCVEVEKNKFRLDQHNHFTFSTASGSHIRVCPTRGKDVEITRIISNKKGEGSILMSLVMKIYVIACSGLLYKNIDEFGTITLECTGAVGYGKNLRDELSISQQAAFFRKFGFRTDVYKKDYIHMKLENPTYINTFINTLIEDLKKSIDNTCVV